MAIKQHLVLAFALYSSHSLESAHILNLLQMYAFNLRKQSTAIVQRAEDITKNCL